MVLTSTLLISLSYVCPYKLAQADQTDPTQPTPLHTNTLQPEKTQNLCVLILTTAVEDKNFTEKQAQDQKNFAAIVNNIGM